MLYPSIKVPGYNKCGLLVSYLWDGSDLLLINQGGQGGQAKSDFKMILFS
jgi:hypothetical protein